MKRFSIEVVVLLVAGLAVAAFANSQVEESIKLTRQYNKIALQRLKAEKDGASTSGTNPVSKPVKSGDSGQGDSGQGDSGEGTTKPDPASSTGGDPKPPSEPIENPTDDVPSYQEPETIDGFQVAVLDDVLFAVEAEGDMREAFLVLDARSKDHYTEGHISGAHPMSFYTVDSDRVEKLRTELELQPIVIIYCNGGDCTDSTGLANELLSICGDLGIGIDGANVQVYKNGMDEFRKKYPQYVVEGDSLR